MNYDDTSNMIKDLLSTLQKRMFLISKINHIEAPPSPLQGKILKYLLENQDKVIYQKTLEEAINTTKSTVSGVLDSMEKNGLIKRIQSNLDARSKQVKLTDKSIKRSQEIELIFKNINQEIIEGISSEEINIFSSVINKMKLNIETNNLKDELNLKNNKGV